MKICVMGAGYVGLVLSVCLASLGQDVVCIEPDPKKLAILKTAKPTIYEESLEPMLQEVIAQNRLQFFGSLEASAQQFGVYYLAVGTPSLPDGSADLQYIMTAVHQIAEYATQDFIVVTKSTVPVGTGKQVIKLVEQIVRPKNIDFSYVSNPEFLREGTAIHDFMHPNRIVLGSSSDKAIQTVKLLYRPLIESGVPCIEGLVEDAEIVKYAANCFLATKISFINEIAQICKLFKSNIGVVAKGIGSDARISDKFLSAGCGYGGSCFPKDVNEFIALAKRHGVEMPLLESVPKVNARQQAMPFRLFREHFNGDISGKAIGVWGAAFKPGTDDIRCSPALELIEQALNDNVKVRIYDPIALDHLSAWLDEMSYSHVDICSSMNDAVDGASALIVLTDWKHFSNPNWLALCEKLNDYVVVDGRGMYAVEAVPDKFSYYSCDAERVSHSVHQN